MDYLRLSGKAAIVTGAGRGIGRTIATKLAEFGCMVMVCDLVEERCIEVVQEITKEGGSAVWTICDITRPDQIENTINQTLDSFGSVEILVNNAGIGSKIIPFWETEIEQWNEMIDINLTGAYRFSSAVFPIMRNQKYGKIINISSGAGVHGFPGNLSYSAAKAGMIGMTKAMALELAQFKINVNAIAVGTTETPLGAETGTNNLDISVVPWGRIGSTVDVADCVLYLASDASEYMTGQVLAPNGGRRT